MDQNSISIELKNILVEATRLAKNINSYEINPLIFMVACLKSKDSDAYKILSIWAEENDFDLEVLYNAMFSSLMQIKEENDKNGENSSVSRPLDRTTKQLFEIAQNEAKRFSITVYSSDFIILAYAMKYPDFFLQFENADFTEDKIKEIIAGRLSTIGGKNAVNPNADEDEEENEDDVNGTPTLDAFSINITQKAKDGKLDVVIGRETEIERITQILNRKNKNNPVLIGEPGVGKTAIVEGYAQKLLNEDDTLRIMQLDLSGLVAGTRYRGEFEERMKRIIKELINHKEIILFIDELHTLVGAGGAEGALEASNILKPYLARGDFKLIGATTTDEYRKYISKDAALERRLQPIIVEAPNVKEAKEILIGCKSMYEKFHHVSIDDEVLMMCVEWSEKYIAGKQLPDKALDVLDETCSKVKTAYKIQFRKEETELNKQLQTATENKIKFINDCKTEEAIAASTEEKQIKMKLEKLIEENKHKAQETPIVDINSISEVISQITGIEASNLTDDEIERLFKMENELKKRVKGQDEAISSICKAIRRWKSGVNDPKRPIGSFMMLGPTGVGKTEIAKALAEYMFGKEDRLIKLDMSEYNDKYSVSKLIGSNPGFVGYEDGTVLSKAIRKHPHSVVLFDEITRADSDVYPIFLQLLNDGELTDGAGHQLSFRNSIVLFTSNLGADKMYNLGKGVVGFGNEDNKTENLIKEDDEIKKIIKQQIEQEFPPEFVNRLDKTLTFKHLSKDTLLEIVDLKLNELSKRVNAKITITEIGKQKLVDYQYEPRFGARPINRSIADNIEDEITSELLNAMKSKKVIEEIDVDYVDDKFTFTYK